MRLESDSASVGKKVAAQNATKVLTSSSSFLHQSLLLKSAGHSPAAIKPFEDVLVHLASAIGLLLQRHPDAVWSVTDVRKQAKLDSDLQVRLLPRVAPTLLATP